MKLLRRIGKWLYKDVRFGKSKKYKLERYSLVHPIILFGIVGIVYLLGMIFSILYLSGAIDLFVVYDLVDNIKFLAALIMIGITIHYMIHLVHKSKIKSAKGLSKIF